MSDPEPPSPNPTVAEQLANLLRQRVCRDVEVLWLDANQQVADATADQEGHKSRISQAVEDPKSIGRNVLARNDVLRSRNDSGCRGRRHNGRRRRVQGQAFSLSNRLGSL